MITTDKTRRAISALKNTDRDFFHGDLDDYLIECLESLQLAPAASDAEFIKKELAFIITASNPAIRIGEMEECIDDWCCVAQREVSSNPDIKVGYIEDDSLVQLTEKDMMDSGSIDFDSKLKYWHLTFASSLIFLAATSFLIWG